MPAYSNVMLSGSGVPSYTFLINADVLHLSIIALQRTSFCPVCYRDENIPVVIVQQLMKQ